MHGISIGDSVACALRPGTDKAICFGNDDEFGQLDPPAGVRLRTLVTGFVQACGISTAGDRRCWRETLK